MSYLKFSRYIHTKKINQFNLFLCDFSLPSFLSLFDMRNDGCIGKKENKQ